MVPTPIVVLLFIATFLLVIWQYLQIDPKRRILNLRFGLMVGAIAGAVGYPLFSFHSPDNRQASWMFLALALFWLATAYYLLRRMPPREEH